MARPKFSVQHFMACLNVAWEGIPGPNVPRTLEGVCHQYSVPFSVEPPIVFEALWLFVRLFRTNDLQGYREFSASVIWLDHPDGRLLVTRRLLGQIRLSNAHPIADVAWAIRNLRLPGFGQYEIQLRCLSRTVLGPKWRIADREYIRIERMP
jgi:hypothetical protein